MKFFKRSLKFGVPALAGLASFQVANADIVADATAELTALKTGAESMGTPIIALIGTIALIVIIMMLVKRAK